MTDVLPDIAKLNGVGVVGICVLVVLALFFEWIVTGKSHRRELADKDEQIRTLHEVIGVKDTQISTLSEVGRTVDAVLQSIKDLAERRSS